MSLIPLLFEEIRPYRRSYRGIDPDELLAPMRQLLSECPYYSQWISPSAVDNTQLCFDKDKFQVNLDVQQFHPSEISVKVTGDNEITVEAKHEEKKDEHGYISRHFVRRYVLPKDHDISKVASSLSSDGVLTITAPRVNSKEVEYRNIPITTT